MNTLPETNIFAPENRACQKETSIPAIHFQVRAVSFREDTSRKFYKSEQIVGTSLVGHNPNGWV